MSDRLDALFRIILERLYGERGANVQLEARSDLKKICSSVERLSAIYTRERAVLDSQLLAQPEFRKAYVVYFLLANLSKVKTILGEIWMHPQTRQLLSSRLRILDLGCGPGTHLLGCADFLADQPLPVDRVECVGVDVLEQNLRDARYFFARFVHEVISSSAARMGVHWNLQTRQADLCQPFGFDEEPFDFIILGNVLNELFAYHPERVEKRLRLVTALVESLLRPQGFLILIEPALRETSRELLLLRDRLLDELPLSVYSPCVHNRHCPAVAADSPSDWCHEDVIWEAPSWIQQIDRRVGFHSNSLKYSYVVFSRLGLSFKEAACAQQAGSVSPEAQIWRVVSEVLEERGKSSVYFCGLEGRAKVTRLKKHSSAANQDFAQLGRGNVVATGPVKHHKPKDWRVVAETGVRVMTGKR